MYKGFNLSLDKSADIFYKDIDKDYDEYIKIGKDHLKDQTTQYEIDLKKYLSKDKKQLNGTEIQNEWFPEIKADIFISHSHRDEELACALAGWLNDIFKLNCFIDSTVWGYSKDLLKEMNDKLSNKSEENDRILYDHESCIQVSAHVNVMLSIALQKMIDKTEAVILLNTEHSVQQVCNDTKMNATYSPWIYSEIVCTQLVRKKPLFMYRDYDPIDILDMPIFEEDMQPKIPSLISYTFLLNHLIPLTVDDLLTWESKPKCTYDLDTLYELKCPDEMKDTHIFLEALEEYEVNNLKSVYNTPFLE